MGRAQRAVMNIHDIILQVGIIMIVRMHTSKQDKWLRYSEYTSSLASIIFDE